MPLVDPTVEDRARRARSTERLEARREKDRAYQHDRWADPAHRERRRQYMADYRRPVTAASAPGPGPADLIITVPAPDVPDVIGFDGAARLPTAEEIRGVLSDQIHRLSRGEISPAQANAVTRKAGKVLVAMKAALRGDGRAQGARDARAEALIAPARPPGAGKAP
jgi:hypothetical protein